MAEESPILKEIRRLGAAIQAIERIGSEAVSYLAVCDYNASDCTPDHERVKDIKARWKAALKNLYKI